MKCEDVIFPRLDRTSLFPTAAHDTSIKLMRFKLIIIMVLNMWHISLFTSHCLNCSVVTARGQCNMAAGINCTQSIQKHSRCGEVMDHSSSSECFYVPMIIYMKY